MFNVWCASGCATRWFTAAVIRDDRKFAAVASACARSSLLPDRRPASVALELSTDRQLSHLSPPRLVEPGTALVSRYVGLARDDIDPEPAVLREEQSASDFVVHFGCALLPGQ